MYRRIGSVASRRFASSRDPPKNENILELFSDLGSTGDDKELLFSFLNHTAGSGRLLVGFYFV
jgi:hypothetical protein